MCFGPTFKCWTVWFRGVWRDLARCAPGGGKIGHNFNHVVRESILSRSPLKCCAGM